MWLPQTYAQAAHARVGDTLTMAGTAVRVAGVYTDLFDTDYGSYWCAYQGFFLNAASANTPPPALVLATDRQTLVTVATAAGFLTIAQQVRVDPHSLSTSTPSSCWPSRTAPSRPRSPRTTRSDRR